MTDANTKHTAFVFSLLSPCTTMYGLFARLQRIMHCLWDLLVITSVSRPNTFLVRFSQWRNQGRFPGGPAAPYFSTNMRKKFFWRPPPLISGSGWPPPPSPLSEGLDPPLVVKVKLMYFLPPCCCGGPPHHSMYRPRLCWYSSLFCVGQDAFSRLTLHMLGTARRHTDKYLHVSAQMTGVSL